MSKFRKTVTIDGSRFYDVNSFYDEMGRIFTKDLRWKSGHNLNAFDDLLRGGFGVFEYEEPINLIWIHFQRSRQLLGEEFIGWLMSIVRKHEHIQFSTLD